MALSLVFTDLGNGAVTYLITGGVSGNAFTIIANAINGDMTVAAPITWVTGNLASGGQAAGTFFATPGYYYSWVNDTSLGTFSQPQYFSCQDGTQTVHYRILTAVVSRLSALTLTAIPNGRVSGRAQAWDRGVVAAGTNMPCVVCSYGNTQEKHNYKEGVVNADDFWYPIMVTMQRENNQSANVGDQGWLHTRYQLMTALRTQRLAGVPEVMLGVIEPLSIALPDAWLKNYDVGGFVVRFQTRIGGRGLTT